MTAVFNINAESRSDVGKGASRRLRHAGKVPAILYGDSKEPTALALDHNAMLLATANEGFYSHILNLNIDGQTHKAVLKDLQRHPARPVILHMDFQRVSENTRVRVHIPVHYIGEDRAPGVKAGGLVHHYVSNIEVSCLAVKMPEYIEVDVSGLNIGEALHLSDLKLPEGVIITELSHGPEHDLAVVSIHAPRVGGEEEAAAPAAEAAAPSA